MLPEPWLSVSELLDDAGLRFPLRCSCRKRERSRRGVRDPERRSSLTTDMSRDEGTADGYGVGYFGGYWEGTGAE